MCGAHPVDDHVWMLGPPHERTELHHRKEPIQIVDLHLGVTAVAHSRQIEDFGTSADLLPESHFKSLFDRSELLSVVKFVQMSEDSHDLRESVDLSAV